MTLDILGSIARAWKSAVQQPIESPEVALATWLKYVASFEEKRNIAERIQITVRAQAPYTAYFGKQDIDQIADRILSCISPELASISLLEKSDVELLKHTKAQLKTSRQLAQSHLKWNDPLNPPPETDDVYYPLMSAMRDYPVLQHAQSLLNHESTDPVSATYALLAHLHSILLAQVHLIELIKRRVGDGEDHLFKLKRLVIVDERDIVDFAKAAYKLRKKIADAETAAVFVDTTVSGQRQEILNRAAIPNRTTLLERLRARNARERELRREEKAIRREQLKQLPYETPFDRKVRLALTEDTELNDAMQDFETAVARGKGVADDESRDAVELLEDPKAVRELALELGYATEKTVDEFVALFMEYRR